MLHVAQVEALRGKVGRHQHVAPAALKRLERRLLLVALCEPDQAAAQGHIETRLWAQQQRRTFGAVESSGIDVLAEEILVDLVHLGLGLRDEASESAEDS